MKFGCPPLRPLSYSHPFTDLWECWARRFRPVLLCVASEPTLICAKIHISTLTYIFVQHLRKKEIVCVQVEIPHFCRILTIVG